MNAAYYAKHPLIQLQHDKGAFTSLRNAFAMCISNASLSEFEKKGHLAAVVAEAKSNAHNYEFSSAMCMFALASVIRFAIESYYPVVNDQEPEENWDSLAKMFNCTIYPKYRSNNDVHNIHIFRCASMPLNFVRDRKIPSNKNHFVALCEPLNPETIDSHYFKPKFPPLKVIQNETTNSAKHVVPSATLTMKQSPPYLGTKRKQVGLEMFLSKKKKNDTPTLKKSILSGTSSAPLDANVQKQARDKVEVNVEGYCNKNSSKTNIIHPKDIYNFVHCAEKLSDAEKYDLLCNVWKPENNYDFLYVMVNNKKKRFQQQWLKNFSWLTYSPAVNGGFCINCVLFTGETNHNSCKLQRLKSSPPQPTSSTVQKLNDHALTSKIHEAATVRATEFKRVMEHKKVGIDLQLNDARRELIEKNRMRLRPVCRCYYNLWSTKSCPSWSSR